ncbi:phage tail protein [Lactiplantibacillus paraxiangfangensis]|uniref:phage tail protein n=1 Tax=Lactiplantibacillus paraxiangfangensis TaxID=3076224 RepID=UPI0030C6980D
MELEELEMLFKVNTDQMEKQFEKIQPMVDKFMGRTADAAKSGANKTAESMDLSKGLAKIQEQLSQITEKMSGSFNKMKSVASTGSSKVGQATSKMFDGSQGKIKQDLEAIVAEINSKMNQARAAQAKMRDLMNRKSSLSTAQQSGSEGVKFDNQIASAQAKMTRYQNQAKNLAQSMRSEFKEVPESLSQIAKAMDQNESKIETYRRQLKNLASAQRDVQDSIKTMGASDKLTKQSNSLDKSIMSTRDKMNKLINSNDQLNKSYAYVSDRGDALKSVIGKLDTELGESSTAASRSANQMNRFGNAANGATNKASGSGKGPTNWFKRMASGISNATSRIRNFGSSSSSSMNKASSSAKRASSSMGGIVQQLKYLPSQLIVFGLLYQGLTQLATGMMTAFKTNAQFASSLNQIKVNLMTAFYPIYNFVLPAVNSLMSALSKATSWLAQFSSALTGMSYSKARQGAQGLYEQSKALNDTAAASSKASASVKKANAEITKQNQAQARSVREANAEIRKQNQAQAVSVREANRQIAESNREGAAKVRSANAAITAANKKSQAAMEATKKKNKELMQSLMGFDELNVLDKSNDDDSTYDKKAKQTFTPQAKQDSPESTPTQTTPESTPLQTSDGAGTDAGGLDFGAPLGQSFNSAAAAAKKLQKILGELFDPMKAAWDTNGKTVTDAAKYAWKEVERALGDVGRSFMHVWDNGTGQKTVEAILQLLADMLNIVGDIAKAFSQAWEGGGGRGTRLIQAIFNSLNDVLKLIHDIATSFRDAWNGGNLGERIFANLITLATNIVRIIGDIAKAFDIAWKHGNTGTKLIQSILNALNAVIKVLDNIAVAFRNAWNSGAGEKIASDLYKIFTNIFNTISALGGQFDKAWKHGNVGSSIFKTLLGMVNDMLGALNDMAGATVKWASKLDFTPLLQSIDRLLKAIRPVVKDVWDGLDWGYQNILLPLAKYTITNLIPAFFDAFAAALKLVHSIVSAATPAFKWLWDSFLKPLAKWTGGIIVGTLKKLASALDGVSSWVDKHHKAVEAMAKVLLTMFMIKVSTSVFNKATGFIGTLVDKATALSANKHLLSEFFGKITGLSDLKEGVKNVKSIWQVSKTLVVDNWHNFVSDAKGLASLTWSSFTKTGALLKDLAKATWSGFMTYVDGAKSLAKLGWSGFMKAGSVLKDLAKLSWTKFVDFIGYAKALAKLSWVKLIEGVKAIKDWSIWSKLAAAGQAIFNAVMDANPVALVVLAIAGLVAGFVALYKHNKKFRDFCNAVWKSITKWFGDSLTWIQKNWTKVIDFIVNPIGTVAAWFLKDTKTGRNILKWAAKLPGKAADWAKGVGKKVSGHISDAKKTFQKAGENIGTWTSDFISGTKKTINKWASGIGKNIHQKVSDGKDLAKKAGKNIGSWTSEFTDKTNGAIKGIKSWASGIGGNIKNKVSDGKHAAQKAGTSIGSWVNDFRSKSSKTLSSWASSLGSKANSGINGAKSLAKSAGSKLGNWVSDFRSGTSKKLSDWAGGLGGKIGKGLSSGWRDVKAGSAAIANGIVSTIGKAVNGVIDGIKWILSHVGASGKANAMHHWSVPKFAKGGRHKGGPALVNDQPGSIYQEAYKLSNGKTGLFPKVRDLMVSLPQNTQIMNATQVAKRMVPHYADGIGDFDFDLSGLSNLKFDMPDISFDFSGLGDLGDFGNFNFGNFNFGNLFDGIGSAVGGFVDSAGDAIESLFDDFKHPDRILKAAMQKFVKFTGLSGYPLDIAKSMVDFSVDNAKSFISGILKKYSTEAGGNLNNPGGSSVNRWRDYVRKGLAANGLSTSPAMIAKVLSQIQTESGGNPMARQPGADPDGDGSGPALGLMQTKRSTFLGNAFSGHKNIFNGYDSILAGLHYAKNRYGSALGFLGHGHGYETGGLGTEEGLYPLFEGNKPEMVLPLTDVPRSMQLIRQALSFMGKTFGDGLQMPAALTQQTNLSSLGSMPSTTSTQNVSSGGINELGPTIVNALLQGLQMANVGGQSTGTQPIDVHLTLQVGNEKFGEAAVKGINAVNQKNGKNMLRL